MGLGHCAISNENYFERNKELLNKTQSSAFVQNRKKSNKTVEFFLRGKKEDSPESSYLAINNIRVTPETPIGFV